MLLLQELMRWIWNVKLKLKEYDVALIVGVCWLLFTIVHIIYSLPDSELQPPITQNKQQADEILLSFINKRMAEIRQV